MIMKMESSFHFFFFCCNIFVWLVPLSSKGNYVHGTDGLCHAIAILYTLKSIALSVLFCRGPVFAKRYYYLPFNRFNYDKVKFHWIYFRLLTSDKRSGVEVVRDRGRRNVHVYWRYSKAKARVSSPPMESRRRLSGLSESDQRLYC